MKKRRCAGTVAKLACMTAAAAVYGAGISLFLDPNDLAPGGVTGISVILNRLTGLETGTLYLLLNLPILMLGVWKLGWRIMGKTAFAIAFTSFFANRMADLGPATEDPLLAAVAGSVLMAAGIGIIFRAGATTGGTDIIVKLIRRRFPWLKTGFLFQCMDMAVVAVSGLVFRDLGTALYALIAVLIGGRALDYMLYGGDEAKLIYVITERPEAIGRRLLMEGGFGVTYLRGSGGFTGEEKQVILCVVRRTQGPLMEEIVKAEDPSAFMIVTSAGEIYGEGYKDFFAEKL